MIRKLLSPEGTLLGSVNIPADWAERIDARGEMDFVISPNLTLHPYRSGEHNLALTYRTGALCRSYNPEYPDALTLYGISLEEFEKLDGCSFFPGAAYLRSIVS